MGKDIFLNIRNIQNKFFVAMCKDTASCRQMSQRTTYLNKYVKLEFKKTVKLTRLRKTDYLILKIDE